MLKRLFASNKRPYFKESSPWDKLDFDLSGCKLQISLPPQDYEFPEKRQGPNLNIFDESLYKYKDGEDLNGFPVDGEGASVGGLLYRNWYTYGSILGASHIGTLSCSMSIFDTSRMQGKLNCFNPRTLEALIINNAYYSYGPGFSENVHQCPANWRIKKINGIAWVYHEAWSKSAQWEENPSPYVDTHFDCRFFTPLFADKYLMINFSSLGSLPAESSNQLMLNRIGQIAAGLKLQLSQEGNKQQSEAVSSHPQLKYSSSREPERWKYYGSYQDGDILEGEPPIVLEGNPSPPPEIS